MVSIRNTSTESPKHNNSLLKGMAALKLLVSSGRSLGITEVARGLELSKSSAHDLLASMVSLGFVDKNEHTRRYALSPAIFDFFGSFANDFGKNSNIQALLRQRTLELDVTLYVSALCRHRSYVTCASGRYGDTMVLGYNCPWYASACGRAVLSLSPESEWERYMPSAESERPTLHTTVEPGRLRALLQECRASGVSWNEGESEAGRVSVAAAIPLLGRPTDRAVALVLSAEELVARDRKKLECQVRQIARDLAAAIQG